MATDYENYSNMIEKLCEKAYLENYEVRTRLCNIYEEFFGYSGAWTIYATHKLVKDLYFYSLRHSGSTGVSAKLFDILETVYCYGELINK